jgi:hypothetical protein
MESSVHPVLIILIGIGIAALRIADMPLQPIDKLLWNLLAIGASALLFAFSFAS